MDEGDECEEFPYFEAHAVCVIVKFCVILRGQITAFLGRKFQNFVNFFLIFFGWDCVSRFSLNVNSVVMTATAQ